MSVQRRADMVGLDCSIIMHPRCGRLSGHFDLFTDSMVDCRECRRDRFRADKVDELPWVALLPGHARAIKFFDPGGSSR